MSEENKKITSIYILKCTPQSLSQAETYLKNRNWKIGSGTDLREAFAYIIRNQPEVILVPSNHSSKKVRSLPKLLAQAFPISIIAYTDAVDSAAMTSLREMNQTYTLYPPLSGPAIERMLLKIEKDLDANPVAKRPANADDANSKQNSENNLIRLKGQNSDAKAAQTFENARAALDRLINEENDEPTPSGPAYMPDHSDSGVSPSHSKHQGAKSESGSFLDQMEQKTHPHHPTSDGSNWEGSLDPKIKSNDGSVEQKISTNVSTNGKKFLFVHGREVTDISRESVVVRGTIQALDTLNSESSPQIIDRPNSETATHVGCIIIDSPRFSGYHLTSLGNGKKIEPDFMNSIKDKLFSFLTEHGEVAHEEPPLHLKIKSVNFEGWALKNAEFVRKTNHHNEDIAVAFFPHHDIRPKLEDASSEKMFKILISELKEDVAVEFDVYIFLPENNRFILYVPKGKNFPEAQKARLLNMGITHLYLPKEAAVEVQKYKTQNQLNENIDLFLRTK